MGQNSGIEWTDATWNPWHGCRKVSAGCKHCYMYRDKTRYGQDPRIVQRSKTKFEDPLRWKEPARVFTCSWSDFFIEEADGWRDEAWDIIRRTPHLTYQILTKRPENIFARLPEDWGEGYPNVWLGVSAENQEMANLRVGRLMSLPARIRFVSAEPLLSRITLKDIQPFKEQGGPANIYVNALRNTHGFERGGNKTGLRMIGKGSIHWVIVGGESGPEAREMAPAWAEWLIVECYEADVPVFLKQLGGYPDKRGGEQAVINGRAWKQFPETEIFGQLGLDL